MNFIKHIGVWKYVGIFTLILTVVVTVYYYGQLILPCIETPGVDCLYDKKYGIYQPFYFGGRIFAIILGLLLFIPSHIFKKWFLFVAIPIILMTVYFVQGISVFSDNFLNPTRAKMAENGMIFLGIVTIVFVATHLIYDLRKRRKSKL